MRFQSTSASCGPAALRTALLCHGVVRSEEELGTLSGFVPADGTSPAGIVRALRSISVEHPQVNPSRISERKVDVAMLRLASALMAGCVVIVCLDNYEHWGTVVGTLGFPTKRFHLYDPAHEELVLPLSPGEMEARWRPAERKPYYGIVV